MIKKQQVLSVTADTFSEKLLVDSVEFTYSAPTKSYDTMCGPLNQGLVELYTSTSCKIKAGTTNKLDTLYTNAFGSKLPAISTSVVSRVGNTVELLSATGMLEGHMVLLDSGVFYIQEVTANSITVIPMLTYTPSVAQTFITYTSNMQSNLLKALEEFPEQAYEHLDLSCTDLILKYPLGGLCTTDIVLTGSTKNSIAIPVLPEALIDTTSVVATRCNISVDGITGSITDLVLNINNEYVDYRCLSSSELIGKSLVNKSVTGSFTIAGAHKDFISGYLIVEVDDRQHGVFAPSIIITKLIERIDDLGVYTEAEFKVIDNKLSLFFS